jgi:ligand-binding SRPBCC domain-containing protein
MPTYERSVRVAAPLDEVWAFHSTGAGLEALTPNWMHLRVEETRGPDGNPDPDVLEQGSTLRASVRPFDIGPRQTWVSHIATREEKDGSAYFRDVMTEGPFKEWEHTHLFFADGDQTIITDSVVFAFPFGPLGRAVGSLAGIGFEPMFWYRHKQTRELLE